MSRPERGSVTVMTLGFLVLLVLLLVLVVNASQAYLERQRLTNLADGAAIAAADGLDLDAFYTGAVVRLDPAASRTLVADHLADAPVDRADVTVDGTTVTVRLARRLDLALVPPGWSDGTLVVAEATAELRTPE